MSIYWRWIHENGKRSLITSKSFDKAVEKMQQKYGFTKELAIECVIEDNTSSGTTGIAGS